MDKVVRSRLNAEYVRLRDNVDPKYYDYEEHKKQYLKEAEAMTEEELLKAVDRLDDQVAAKLLAHGL